MKIKGILAPVKALHRKVAPHTYGFSFTVAIFAFVIFTLSGIFGFLPNNIQEKIQPHYVAVSDILHASSGGDEIVPEETDKSVVASIVGVKKITSAAPDIEVAQIRTTAALAQGSSALKNQSHEVSTRVFPPLVYTTSGTLETPQSIFFPSIKKEVSVFNPEEKNLATLSSFLLKGAVRYPESAFLNQDGNVFIFGHSSYAKIVKNQAYKAFTGIYQLKAGEEIQVTGTENVYVYKIRSVQSVTNAAAIPLSNDGRTLTLSTCNVPGSVENRVIVIADLISSHPKPIIIQE